MRLFTLIPACFTASFGLRAAADGDEKRIKTPGNQALISERYTNGFKPKPLEPGPEDAHIARVAAAILERNHYLQQPFDDSVSSKFLDKYLDALDPAHLVFFQTDLAQYEKWRTKLDDMTLALAADTSPADIIFNRFLERFAQQVEYATNLIANEKFEFKGNDRYMPNRKELPRPKDLTD